MNLESFVGSVDEDTAAELGRIVERRRRARTRTHRERVAEIVDAIEA